MANIPKRKSSSALLPSMIKSPSETSNFVSDPVSFLSKRRAKKGEVFGGRVFHWSVIFAGSYGAVQEVFNDDDTFLHVPGYNAFTGMKTLFGDNVLFTDKPQSVMEKMRLDDCIVFNAEHCSDTVFPVVHEVADHVAKWISAYATQHGGAVQLHSYKTCKNFCVDMFSRLFMFEPLLEVPLQLDLADDANAGKKKKKVASGIKVRGDQATAKLGPIHFVKDADKVSALSSVLWKGMQSSGMKFGGVVKSAYGDGEVARTDLLQLFHSSRTANTGRCPFQSTNAKEPGQSQLSREETGRYYLLATSSMVTKGISSLVTSFLLEMKRPEHAGILNQLRTSRSSEEPRLYLRKVLREVERLCPPVIGCCRATSSDKPSSSDKAPFDTITLEKGTKVWCSFYTANREPSVFENPDELRPERWDCKCESRCFEYSDEKSRLCSKLKDTCTFGGGPRACIGKDIGRIMIEEICLIFLDNFEWAVMNADEKGLEYRWLPVSRPKDDAVLELRPR